MTRQGRKKASAASDRPACVGIDLAGVEYRETGVAILRDGRLERLTSAGSDAEILALALMAGPGGTVAVNAPLTRPRGRCCLDDDCPCRRDPGTRSRQLERELARMGVPTLATALIKVLARRGGRVASALRDLGYEPIEVYPFATLRLLGLPTAGKKTEAGRKAIHRAPQALGARPQAPEGLRAPARRRGLRPHRPPLARRADPDGRRARRRADGHPRRGGPAGLTSACPDGPNLLASGPSGTLRNGRSRTMEGPDRATIWFAGDLDDPWVAAIAEALPRDAFRIDCPDDLPEAWPIDRPTPVRPGPPPLEPDRDRRPAHRPAQGPGRPDASGGPLRRAPRPLCRGRALVEAGRLRDPRGDGPRDRAPPRPGRSSDRQGRSAPSGPGSPSSAPTSSCGPPWPRPPGPAASRSRPSPSRPRPRRASASVWDVPVLEPDWPARLATLAKSGPVVALLGFADRATRDPGQAPRRLGLPRPALRRRRPARGPRPDRDDPDMTNRMRCRRRPSGMRAVLARKN